MTYHERGKVHTMNNIEKAIKRGKELLFTVKQLKVAGCNNEDIQNALAEMRDKEQRRKTI